MWYIEESSTTTGTPASVWSLWTDVAHWHVWNPAIVWSKLNGPFAVGSQGETQPNGGPKSTFVLTEVQPEKRWVNRTRFPLAVLDIIHELTPMPAGTRITMRMQLTGPLAWLFARLFGRTLRAHLPDAVKNLAHLAAQTA